MWKGYVNLFKVEAVSGRVRIQSLAVWLLNSDTNQVRARTGVFGTSLAQICVLKDHVGLVHRRRAGRGLSK